jgi:transposase
MKNDIQIRTEAIEDFLTGRVTVKEASRRLGLHRISFWRLVKKYQSRGSEGLVHGLRGKSSNNAKPLSLKIAVCRRHRRYALSGGRNLLAFYRRSKGTFGQDLSYAAVRLWVRAASTHKREEILCRD